VSSISAWSLWAELAEILHDNNVESYPYYSLEENAASVTQLVRMPVAPQGTACSCNMGQPTHNMPNADLLPLTFLSLT